MSEQNKDAKPDSAPAKAISAEDVERERAHAQHFKTLHEEAQAEAQRLRDEVRTLREQQDQMRAEHAKTPEELEALRKDIEARLRGELDGELTKYKTTAEQLSAKVKELTVVSRVYGAHKDAFNEDVHDDVKARIRQFVDLDENENLIVRDEKGQVRYSKAHPSKPMTPEEFIQELQQSKPSWVKPTKAGGARVAGEKLPPAGAANLPRTLAEFNALPRSQQLQIGAQHPEHLKSLFTR